MIINYDLTELKTNSFHKYKIYFNDSDSIRIKVKVLNHEGILLNNISVYNSKDRYGKLTDKDGLALLSFKKEPGSKKIEASNICCGNYSFMIDTKLNYEIEVYLSEGLNKPRAIKDQIEKYKIVKLTRKIIKLKRDTYIIELIKDQK